MDVKYPRFFIEMIPVFFCGGFLGESMMESEITNHWCKKTMGFSKFPYSNGILYLGGFKTPIGIHMGLSETRVSLNQMATPQFPYLINHSGVYPLSNKDHTPHTELMFD